MEFSSEFICNVWFVMMILNLIQSSNKHLES